MLISGPLASSFSQDQTSGVNSLSKPQQASKPSPNLATSQDDTVTLHHTEPPLLRPPSTIGGIHQTEPPVQRPPSTIGGITAPPVQRLPISTIRRHHDTAPPLPKPPTSTISDLYSTEPPSSGPPTLTNGTK